MSQPRAHLACAEKSLVAGSQSCSLAPEPPSGSPGSALLIIAYAIGLFLPMLRSPSPCSNLLAEGKACHECSIWTYFFLGQSACCTGSSGPRHRGPESPGSSMDIG